MTDKYKDWIVRYYASHDDIPEGLSDGHIVHELIRCKDCKHYWESAGMCTNAKLPVSDSIEPNDYCSRAERKTE